MLVLTRRVGETLMIGDSGEIRLTVLDNNYNQVKLGIAAPRSISIYREEVFYRVFHEKMAANDEELLND